MVYKSSSLSPSPLQPIMEPTEPTKRSPTPLVASAPPPPASLPAPTASSPSSPSSPPPPSPSQDQQQSPRHERDSHNLRHDDNDNSSATTKVAHPSEQQYQPHSSSLSPKVSRAPPLPSTQDPSRHHVPLPRLDRIRGGDTSDPHNAYSRGSGAVDA
ncbi:hypothetical protein BGZ94_006375 [Podila epigama]|nr:hypothetical protein BGZ94_006375 [Podila epigama]